jgi:hypothetical protein
VEEGKKESNPSSLWHCKEALYPPLGWLGFITSTKCNPPSPLPPSSFEAITKSWDHLQNNFWYKIYIDGIGFR